MFGLVVEHLTKLRLVKLPVNAAARQQLVVGPLLGDHAVFYDEDAVCLENCGKSVGNDDIGSPFHDALQCVLDGVFGDGVQRGGSLIQDQDARVFEHHASDRKALLLTARELEPAVSHLGFIAFGLVYDEVVDIGDAAGGLQFLLCRVLLGIQQIVADGAVEEIALLRDNADVRAQEAQIIAFDIDVVDAHLTAGHVIQTRNEIDQCGFARARGANNGIHLSCGNVEADIPKQRLFRDIGKLNMLKADFAAFVHGGSAPVGRRDDGDLPVKVIKDTGKESKRSGKVHLDIQKRFHRTVQAVDESDRGCDRTDREGGIGAGDDEPAARKVDQQRADLGEHAHHHAKPLAAALLFKGKARDLLVDGNEALVLPPLTGEELDQQRAGDGKCLIDELVHLVALGLTFIEKLEARAAHAAGREDQQRDHENAHDGKLPAHGKERDQGRDHRGNIAHDAGKRAGNDGAYAADIGIHAGDDVALLLGGEEGVGHVLEMVVHLVFHVENDALGDPGVDIAFQHTDDL